VEPLQEIAHFRVRSIIRLLLISGDDKNAYLWNFSGESLNNMTVVDALPHCKDSLNPQGND
jgi:hypothetical protein